MMTLAVGLAGTAAVTGCSSSGTVSAASSVPTASPTVGASLTAAQRADRAALASYTGMWTDVVAASRTANYADPALADHMTGQALALWTNALKSENSKGIVASEGHPVLRPSIVSATPAANPAQVVVQDCVSDANWLQRYRNGSPVNHVPGGKRLTQALITTSGDRWKVSRLVVEAVGTC